LYYKRGESKVKKVEISYNGQPICVSYANCCETAKQQFAKAYKIELVEKISVRPCSVK